MLQNIGQYVFLTEILKTMKNFTEFEQIERFMKNRDIARAKDLREFGISGTAISRAAAEGILIRLSRGIYTTPDANMDASFQLAG